MSGAIDGIARKPGESATFSLLFAVGNGSPGAFNWGRDLSLQ